MEFSITPYNGDSPMRPWPSLAGNAFYLNYGAGLKESLFFSIPSGRESPGIALIRAAWQDQHKKSYRGGPETY